MGVCVVRVVQLNVFSFYSVLWYMLRFPRKTIFVCTSICFVAGDPSWCPSRFPYFIMLVSFNSNTTDATSGTGPADPSGAPEFIPCFSGCSIFSFMCPVLSFTFSFGHCIFFSFLICGFWLALSYLPSFLIHVDVSACYFSVFVCESDRTRY